MTMMAMAVPIMAGKTEQWRRFAGELMGTRHHDYVTMRKELGVHERVFLQRAPQGDMVIVTLEGKDPIAAFRRFGSANEPFARWFREQVLEIHGMDLAKPPPTMPEMMIDSEGR